MGGWAGPAGTGTLSAERTRPRPAVSMVAGLVTTTVTAPVDMVKTNMVRARGGGGAQGGELCSVRRRACAPAHATGPRPALRRAVCQPFLQRPLALRSRHLPAAGRARPVQGVGCQLGAARAHDSEGVGRGGRAARAWENRTAHAHARLPACADRHFCRERAPAPHVWAGGALVCATLTRRALNKPASTAPHPRPDLEPDLCPAALALTRAQHRHPPPSTCPTTARNLTPQLCTPQPPTPFHFDARRVNC